MCTCRCLLEREKCATDLFSSTPGTLNVSFAVTPTRLEPERSSISIAECQEARHLSSDDLTCQWAQVHAGLALYVLDCLTGAVGDCRMQVLCKTDSTPAASASVSPTVAWACTINAQEARFYPDYTGFTAAVKAALAVRPDVKGTDATLLMLTRHGCCGARASLACVRISSRPVSQAR
jgi:hypothetical protein